MGILDSLEAAWHAVTSLFTSKSVGSPTAPCPAQAELAAISQGVNPTNSTKNCGNIVDSVIDRLTGKNPSAVAPDAQDGSFGEIGKRHGTKIEFGKSFDDAFKTVKDGGDGTTAIVGIKYKGGTASHVVVMTNRNGQVGIVEGQDWGAGNPKEVITTPERAKERYGTDSDVGVGVVSSAAGITPRMP